MLKRRSMLRAIGALNMKHLASARRIACVLVLLLGAFGAERKPTDETNAAKARAEYTRANVVGLSFASASEPIVAAPSVLDPQAFGFEFIPAASAKASTAEKGNTAAAIQSPVAAVKPIVVALRSRLRRPNSASQVLQ